MVRVLKGHEGGVISVSWSPDGKRIVSGSRDKTLRIWDASSGQSLQTLEGHSAGVDSVAWSPDGHRIGSVGGSIGQSLRIWESRIEDALPMWRAAERRRQAKAAVAPPKKDK